MPLNRGGLGTIAWHACRGLQEAGLLREVLAPEVGAAGPLRPLARAMPWISRKVMAALNRLRWHGWHDPLFDQWVASHLPHGNHYFGWLHQSLACIRKCHEWGGKAGVDRGSVEPRLQDLWLREEYAKYGLRSPPVTPAAVHRMVQEADEADWIMAPSSLVAESYQTAGYDRGKIRINPLGVELPPAPSVEKRCDGRFRFLFVGQLSLQKGVPLLLEAWHHLDLPGSELILAGIIPPAEQQIIRPLLARSRHVVWNGHCSDVPALMRRCDAFVLPSVQDGFGLVVLEAMANGLPVIVSDRVGAKDCVAEGQSGFIFPSGSQRGLEERIEWFVRNGTRAQDLGLFARTSAERCSWPEYGRRFASLLRSVSGI